jgi:hypothetical protein
MKFSFFASSACAQISLPVIPTIPDLVASEINNPEFVVPTPPAAPSAPVTPALPITIPDIPFSPINNQPSFL